VKAIYVDIGFSWSDPASSFRSIVDAGYNLVILAFLVSGAPYDAASAWLGMGSTAQLATISYAHTHNARIIVSAGGSTDTPYNAQTGTQYGTAAANWAVANNLDGLDFDLENFGSGFTGGSLSSAATITWVVDATNAARSILTSSRIITHAPQAPYFGPSNGYNNAYPQIYARATSINFLLVQYYNSPPYFTTYAQLFTSSGGGSVQEIVAEGVPQSKIVVGKTVLSGDGGSSSYVSASTLHSWFATALSQYGWNTGVMGWQWHDPTTNGAWISTVY